MTPLQHWFSAQCNHFSGSGLMASCEEWNGSGVWHSDGKPSHLSHSGWKGKNLSKGDRGWQSPWTSRQSLGSRQNSHRLQRTGPSVASSFSWNYISFSSPSASSSESASTLAVHDQTERPISSWVSESLDMLSHIVRRAAVPSCGGRMKTSQTSEARALVTARAPAMKLPIGEAKLPHHIEDPGMNDRPPPLPGGGSDMSAMSCPCLAFNGKKKNKCTGPADADPTSTPVQTHLSVSNGGGNRATRQRLGCFTGKCL